MGQVKPRRNPKHQLLFDFSATGSKRELARLTHGGEASVGRRKEARPFCERRPLHLILKSSKARGPQSLLARPVEVRGLIDRHAARNGVRIYRYANAGNHLHLLIQAKTRAGFRRFLRTIAGLIARRLTGARKGAALSERFWDLLAFSRVVAWGRAFHIALNYVAGNELPPSGHCWSREPGRAWPAPWGPG
jgi:REP element-mobilizing transposase RayT